MSICVKLAAPTVVFVMIAIGLIATPIGLSLEPQSRVALLGMTGACAIAATLGHALTVAQSLTRLPALARATAWGERTGPFPGMGQRDEAGRAAHDMYDLAVSVRDLIAQRAEMERLAMTDPLTGLPNRRGMFHLFEEIYKNGEGPGDPNPLGILHLDIDHFKAVNDRFGHEAGDYVLQQAVRLIASAIRDSDAIVRLGGDEFIVIAPGIESERMLERIAERIVVRFQEPIIFRDRTCEIGASIGLVLGGQRGRVPDPARLLLNADIALCQAKANGRSGYALFDSEMARTRRQVTNHADEIRKALNDEAFEPFFQPVVDLGTGSIIALEAMARWRRPGYGALAAEDFIETAEAHSMIEDLGLQVLEKTCRAMADWRARGLVVPVVHFNVSRTQLLGGSVVDAFSWTLDNHGIESALIAVEISEADLFGRGSELLVANLRRLADQGFQIVIDDFGVQGGALDALSALPVRCIKAGTTITAHIADDRAVPSPQLRCLTALAAEFQMILAAKHIETDGQLAALKRLGLQSGQGRYVADAMDIASVEAWMSDRSDVAAHAERVNIDNKAAS